MNSEVRVRFAPSPTGIPHVGNIRTALFDYFTAKATDGTFILRIEDTDQARKEEGAVEKIKESLLWLGAQWDEYAVQSERLGEYKKFTQQLVDEGKAREEEGAVRFIVPKEPSEEIKWTDAVGKREISYQSKDVEDFIILKKDGYPTYHMANVVDDHLMGITHVIRGEEWVPSTPKHILLYRAFQWEAPTFAHVPNVLGPDGKKLSKRFGAKNVLNYKEEGYLSEALLNSLMLLGWAPKNDREIVSKEDIIKEFSLANVNSSPAMFNEVKLQSIQSEYFRKMSEEDLLLRIEEFDSSIKDFDKELIIKLLEPSRTRMKTLADFKTLVEPFLKGEKFDGNDELKLILFEKFSSIDEWNGESVLSVIREILSEKVYKPKDLYEAVIGVGHGLPLSDSLAIIGKEKTLQLLQ